MIRTNRPINGQPRVPFYAQLEIKRHAKMQLGMWSAATGALTRKFPYPYVTDFDISHDGKWIIIVSGIDGVSGSVIGSTVRCVNISTGTVLWTYQRTLGAPDNDPNGSFVSTAISPNDKYVVLLGWQNVPSCA